MDPETKTSPMAWIGRDKHGCVVAATVDATDARGAKRMATELAKLVRSGLTVAKEPREVVQELDYCRHKKPKGRA